MKSEIEVKFLDVVFDDIRKKLTELGGECEQLMREMKRVTIDNDFMKDGKNAFLRVRDEGDKVTMTYKQFDDLSVDGAKEIEVEVSDYDTTVALLARAGLPVVSEMHTRRENWRLSNVEIMLDEWPWLKPYIEIEGESEEDLRRVAAQLGLSWNDAVFGDVMAAYRVEYPHLTLKDTVTSIPEIKFGDPLPRLLTLQKKVAKLVIIDKDDNYLLMYRSNHPTFANDPDLPGGTLEAGESTLETMIREVNEEIGVKVNADDVRELYAGSEYSNHGTFYALYETRVTSRPEITLSWEHTSYEWIPRDAFIEKTNAAIDTYMQMVGRNA